jgi:hypothetical protein
MVCDGGGWRLVQNFTNSYVAKIGDEAVVKKFQLKRWTNATACPDTLVENWHLHNPTNVAN